MKSPLGFNHSFWTLDISDHEACKKLLEDLEQTPSLFPEKRLCCSTCGQIITHDQERITIDGSHAHHFTNPHGIAFHIGCFRTISGCLENGLPTEEFTWFSGYAWRIVHCGSCRQHMGWSFHSENDIFFGLILDRLVFPH